MVQTQCVAAKLLFNKLVVDKAHDTNGSRNTSRQDEDKGTRSVEKQTLNAKHKEKKNTSMMDRVLRPREQHLLSSIKHPSYGSIASALYEASYCTERPDAAANGGTTTRVARYICTSRSEPRVKTAHLPARKHRAHWCTTCLTQLPLFSRRIDLSASARKIVM